VIQEQLDHQAHLAQEVKQVSQGTEAQPGIREIKEQLDLLEKVVPKDRVDPLASLELLVNLVQQVQLGLKANKAQEEKEENRETLVRQDHQGNPEALDPLDHQGLLDHLVQLVLLDLKAHAVKLDHREAEDSKELQVELDQMARKDLKDLRECQAP